MLGCHCEALLVCVCGGGCWFVDFLARRSCVDSSFATFTAVKFCGLACLMLCIDVCFGF